MAFSFTGAITNRSESIFTMNQNHFPLTSENSNWFSTRFHHNKQGLVIVINNSMYLFLHPSLCNFPELHSIHYNLWMLSRCWNSLKISCFQFRTLWDLPKFWCMTFSLSIAGTFYNMISPKVLFSWSNWLWETVNISSSEYVMGQGHHWRRTNSSVCFLHLFWISCSFHEILQVIFYCTLLVC